MNGFPVYPSGQEQTGLWFTTKQIAWVPHVPIHGSLHFWFKQAWFWGQSELIKHSGLHKGGVPRYSGAQVHTAWSFTSLHILFGPHGDGLHGLVFAGAMIQLILL